MALCQAVGCNNSTFKNNDKSFYLLPNKEKLRKAWLEAINIKRKDKLPKKAFICSDQFEEKCSDAS